MTVWIKRILVGALFCGSIALFAATMPTFGRRCAQAFDPNSAAYERCIDRLITGGGVHFVKKIELVPVDD